MYRVYCATESVKVANDYKSILPCTCYRELDGVYFGYSGNTNVYYDEFENFNKAVAAGFDLHLKLISDFTHCQNKNEYDEYSIGIIDGNEFDFDELNDVDIINILRKNKTIEFHNRP